jgi:hypothetical protein
MRYSYFFWLPARNENSKRKTEEQNTGLQETLDMFKRTENNGVILLVITTYSCIQ